MFLNLFRLKDWALIGPVAAASLVLGLWGFLASGHTLGDSVIQTIGLIRGAGSYAYGKAPIQLVIAQYLLPASALFGGAKLLLVNMRRDMRVALAHRARNHVIVCGLGDTGMQIVNSMHRAGKPVVAIALDGAGANALACERLGIPVLNGDASQPGLLKLAGLLRADSVIVTTGSDAQNLEVGLSAADLLSAQGRNEVKLLIEVRSDWVLDTLADHRTASLGGVNVEFQLFNTAIDTARLLLRMPAFLQLRSSSDDPSAPHVVLAGFGNASREVARRAICSNFALPGVRAAISVLSQDAQDVEARFRGRDAALAALADFSFETYTFGAERPDVWPAIGAFLGRRRAGAVVVALEDDDDSLYAAFQFRACLDRLDQLATPVFVRLKEQHKLAAFLKQVESHPLLPNRLVPFGSLQLLTSPEILLGHELDGLARAGHEIYAASVSSGERSPASVPWQHLPERFKASSRAQADHIAIALGAIGYRVVPGAPKIDLPADDVERLAEIEHWRWCVERRSAGWTYAQVRDDVLKYNPLLKEWRELAENERHWNREMARRVPDVLARENLGLMKEREVAPDQVASRSATIQRPPSELQIVRVDPLSDRDLADADTACESASTRVRLVWKSAGQLKEIERRLELHPKVAAAIEGWSRS